MMPFMEMDAHETIVNGVLVVQLFSEGTESCMGITATSGRGISVDEKRRDVSERWGGFSWFYLFVSFAVSDLK